MFSTERQLKEENEQLRWQVIEAEDRERRQREQAEREREARRQEARERYRQQQCEADTWEDGFARGIPRIQSELHQQQAVDAELAADPQFADRSPGAPWFEQWLREVERAQAIYREEVAEVERQIERLRAEALTKAADRLAAEFPDDCGSVQALRENDPSYLVNW